MKRLVSLIFAALILAGCGKTVHKFIPENPTVLDLEYAQNSERLPAPASVQNISGKAFKSRYFKIWFDDAPLRAEIDTFWGLNYAKGRHFDAAGRIYNDTIYQSIRINANEEAFGLISEPAITVKNALLRNIPSDLPIFGDPSEPGEGEPFYYAANGRGLSDAAVALQQRRCVGVRAQRRRVELDQKRRDKAHQPTAGGYLRKF